MTERERDRVVVVWRGVTGADAEGTALGEYADIMLTGLSLRRTSPDGWDGRWRWG